MNKLFKVLGLTLALALAATFAYAKQQPQEQKPSEQPAPFFPTFKGKIGYELKHLDYEFDTDTQKGYFNGVMVGADFHLNDVYLSAEFAYLWGDTDWESPGYATDSTTDKMYDLKAVFGYDFIFGKFAVTPYAGLAMRFWETSVDGSWSYPYSFQQYYAPFGVQLAYKGCGPWTAMLKLEYDLFMLGQIDYRLSQADPNYSDADYDQSGGYGLYISADFSYSFGCWGLGIEPFYQYWDIEESDSELVTYAGTPVGYVSEPANKTNIWGLKFYIEF